VDTESKIPLTQQLVQQMKLLLASENIAIGTRLPSLRELAAQLEISFLTVRAAYRQLEEEGAIRTRQGVGAEVIARDLSQMRSKSGAIPTHSIGVIIPAFSGYFSPMIAGIEDAAGSDPALFFICDAQEDPQLAENYLDRLIARGVDGIMLISRELANRSKIDEIKANAQAFPPIVAVDIPGYPGPSIRFDLEGGNYAAAQHLLEHGHKRVGLVLPPRKWSNVAEGFSGIQRAFAEANLRIDEDLIAEIDDYTLESGRMAARKLLNLPDAPTAILAIGDNLAAGVYQIAREQSLRIPQDLALMAFNDSDYFPLFDPPMSTIKVPTFELGVAAYQSLRQAIDGEKNIPDQILDTQLLIRRSCGCSE
jgi:DNA-binding LacI/PurR family transcriptional regulator